MNGRRSALIGLAIMFMTAGLAPAQATARYPYRLVIPGTLGGPSNYLDAPGVPFTSGGTLIGTADIGTRDKTYRACPSNFCDGYQQRAFAWRNGRLTDLGVLPGTTGSFVDQLNSHGVGAGGTENELNPNNPVGDAAVLFEHGRVISLGTLPGGSRAFAQNIDDQGQVAGYSNNGIRDPFSVFGWRTQTRAFVWRDGVMADLGSLGGPDTVMSWQNDRGQIVGMSDTSYAPDPANNGSPGYHPFLWQSGHLTDLGSLGGTIAGANWINDRGQVVGVSNLRGDKVIRPFLWADGRMKNLGSLGGVFAAANYISADGDIAGTSSLPGNHHADAVLWRNGKRIALPPVGGAATANGNAANDHGQVVGNENDAHNNEIIAALWTANGRGYDLNTLVAPSSFRMISADYIDDKGDIVGHGFYTRGPNKGDARMFLLVRSSSVPLPRVGLQARLSTNAFRPTQP
jgi:probable HAF family extracellular repeat protein